MSWIKTTLLLGVVLLAAGFAVGVEPSSTTVAGRSYSCDSVISANWLVPGTPESAPAPDPRESPSERATRLQVDKQCNSTAHTAQWLTWTLLALGLLTVIATATTLRPKPLPIAG